LPIFFLWFYESHARLNALMSMYGWGKRRLKDERIREFYTGGVQPIFAVLRFTNASLNRLRLPRKSFGSRWTTF
jgi:hypothetical protein